MFTWQATGDETEIFETSDDNATPVVLVPFMDDETQEDHLARVKIIVDALNAANYTMRYSY